MQPVLLKFRKRPGAVAFSSHQLYVLLALAKWQMLDLNDAAKLLNQKTKKKSDAIISSDRL